ncbi:CvpA family protein [Metabacillus sp. 84]|uniref:CvpA family protein n=1 Tax=unclassified Metabacillus TaxID=2675274 RepID=UPI003CF11D24
MLDLILAVVLLFGILTGLRRGFIMQLVHLTGFIAAYIVAYLYYDDLAPKLELWIPYPSMGEGQAAISFFTGGQLEEAYYRAIAFAILFFGTKIVTQIIGSMLDFVAMLPVLKHLNRWGGAILGFAEIYLIVFILLFAGGLLPMENVQNAMENSALANTIVHHTPYFSDKVNELWIQYTGKP